MIQSPNQHGLTLTKLVSSLAHYPDDVFIEAVPTETGQMWQVRVAARDFGNVIGYGGTHAMALRVLMISMGRRIGQDYNLRVASPSTSLRYQSPAIPAAKNYDVREPVQLLRELLALTLMGEPNIVCEKREGRGRMLGHEEFVIRACTSDVQDYEALVEELQVGRDQDTNEPKQMALIHALHLLFIAYGKKRGVGIYVGLPE